MNRFITFEGVEGSGKTTQVALASRFLADRGVDHVATKEPGGTRIGERLREILLDPSNTGMLPTTELLLIAAARVQHIEQVIRPAIAAGKVVLCDRFADSTAAYQGHGRRIPPEILEPVSRIASMDLAPGLTFLFDLPVEEGLHRVRELFKSDERRIDDEAVEFHRRVREGYLELARAHPERFRVLNGAEPRPKLSGAVSQILRDHLALP